MKSWSWDKGLVSGRDKGLFMEYFAAHFSTHNLDDSVKNVSNCILKWILQIENYFSLELLGIWYFLEKKTAAANRKKPLYHWVASIQPLIKILTLL